MRMTLANRTEYYNGYNKIYMSTRNTGAPIKRMAARIADFTPALWVLLFAILTGLVNFLGR